jgi:hypothetical protein
MRTTQSARRAALAIGVAGASLISFAGGSAVAGHGHMMKEHPLRGDFPLASSEQAPAGVKHGATTDAKAHVPQSATANRGDWLRGDFPRTVAGTPAAVPTAQEGDGNVRVYTEAASQIPGFSKLGLEEVRLEPGAALDVGTTTTAFICEMAQGELEAVIDGATVTRGIGDVWTCPMTQVGALHTNTGTTPAMMRVIHLIAD